MQKKKKKKRKIQPDLYNIMLFVLQDAIRKENVYRLEVKHTTISVFRLHDHLSRKSERFSNNNNKTSWN